jgi:hypothetical protein
MVSGLGDIVKGHARGYRDRSPLLERSARPKRSRGDPAVASTRHPCRKLRTRFASGPRVGLHRAWRGKLRSGRVVAPCGWSLPRPARQTPIDVGRGQLCRSCRRGVRSFRRATATQPAVLVRDVLASAVHPLARCVACASACPPRAAQARTPPKS